MTIEEFTPFITHKSFVIDVRHVIGVRERLSQFLEPIGVIFYTKDNRQIEVILDSKHLKQEIEYIIKLTNQKLLKCYELKL